MAGTFLCKAKAWLDAGLVGSMTGKGWASPPTGRSRRKGSWGVWKGISSCRPGAALDRTFASFSAVGVPGASRANWVASVSRELYASRRHFQPPDSRCQRGPRDFPMEGLLPSQQATHDDPYLRGVPAPVLTACLRRFPAHSLLGLAS